MKRGTDDIITESWIGAVVNYYVGAPTYQEALSKAVSILSDQGMELIDLWGGQVFQLELDRWWDGHVIANYEEHRDSFPGQDEIAKLVAEGAVFHGPFAGWDFE